MLADTARRPGDEARSGLMRADHCGGHALKKDASGFEVHFPEQGLELQVRAQGIVIRMGFQCEDG